jgi:hypothetical protein
MPGTDGAYCRRFVAKEGSGAVAYYAQPSMDARARSPQVLASGQVITAAEYSAHPEWVCVADVGLWLSRQQLQPYLPERFEEWSVDDVAAWARELELDRTASLLAQHDVDGAMAAALTDDNLRFGVGMSDSLERRALLRAIQAMTIKVGSVPNDDAAPLTSVTSLSRRKQLAAAVVLAAQNTTPQFGRGTRRDEGGASLLGAVQSTEGNHRWWRWVGAVVDLTRQDTFDGEHDVEQDADTEVGGSGNDARDLVPQLRRLRIDRGASTRSKFAPWCQSIDQCGGRAWERTLDEIKLRPLMPLEFGKGQSLLISAASSNLQRSILPSTRASRTRQTAERKNTVFQSNDFTLHGVSPATLKGTDGKSSPQADETERECERDRSAGENSDKGLAECSLVASFRYGKARRTYEDSGPEWRRTYDVFRECDTDSSGSLCLDQVKLVVEKLLQREMTDGMMDKVMSAMLAGGGAVSAATKVQRATNTAAAGTQKEEKQEQETSVNFHTFYKWWSKSLVQQFVCSIPLFSELNSVEQVKMAKVMQQQRYNEGELIITQGAQDTSMFVLSRGTAMATLDSPTAPRADAEMDSWGHWILRSYNVGDYFGEVALLRNQPRSAYVRVVQGPAHVLKIERSVFEELLGPCIELLRHNAQTYQNIDSVKSNGDELEDEPDCDAASVDLSSTDSDCESDGDGDGSDVSTSNSSQAAPKRRLLLSSTQEQPNSPWRTPNGECRAVFARVDTDDSGLITLDELKEVRDVCFSEICLLKVICDWHPLTFGAILRESMRCCRCCRK